MKKVGLLLTSILLGACAFGPTPEPKSFLLNPGPAPGMAAMRADVSASVSFVDVGVPFSSDGFAYQISPERWEIDPYNKFLVSPAEMFTGILRTWLRESGLYRSVALPDEGGGQAFVIDCDVTEFYGDFQDPSSPKAVLKMDVQVFKRTSQGPELVLRRTFEQSIPFQERRPQALVDAWSEALRLNLDALLGALAEKAR